MAGVNVKMGVSGVNSFKQSMNESKEAVKTLNEALKANAAQLELTGDKEGYAEKQAALLKQQIEAQKNVFDSATKAMETMRQSGVDPSSTSFQKMQQQALKAQTELANMQTKLRDVETGATDAKDDTERMNEELRSVGQGISWQNVTEGLGKIVSTLESGARAAYNFGKKLYRYVESSADWADELKEMADETGYSVVELQKMQNVAEIVDTSVDAIVTAQNRMKNAVGKAGGKQTLEETLGITLTSSSTL